MSTVTIYVLTLHVCGATQLRSVISVRVLISYYYILTNICKCICVPVLDTIYLPCSLFAQVSNVPPLPRTKTVVRQTGAPRRALRFSTPWPWELWRLFSQPWLHCSLHWIMCSKLQKPMQHCSAVSYDHYAVEDPFVSSLRISGSLPGLTDPSNPICTGTAGTLYLAEVLSIRPVHYPWTWWSDTSGIGSCSNTFGFNTLFCWFEHVFSTCIWHDRLHPPSRIGYVPCSQQSKFLPGKIIRYFCFLSVRIRPSPPTYIYSCHYPHIRMSTHLKHISVSVSERALNEWRRLWIAAKKMSDDRCRCLHRRCRNSHNKCSPCVCVCVCVWERERERERVCVCERENGVCKLRMSLSQSQGGRLLRHKCEVTRLKEANVP